MISGIEGRLESKDVDSVVLRAGPLSLILYVSASTMSQLGETGTVVSLYTHLYVREENISLFGFISRIELKLFQQLITVSGVGPRLGLALLSSYPPQQLITAIVSNNVALLSSTPGVGKKIAGRIVLELKNKFEKDEAREYLQVYSEDNQDVIAALVNLGYSIREASNAVSALPAGKDFKLEEKITIALRQLAAK
ncbi:MAG TPA: Holliday junction branch migration protein RuvA [Dehalococcoidia bacterium]|nr:Holliday junction branch migration protein RuvA [Dehalococcoidia bacterium]